MRRPLALAMAALIGAGSAAAQSPVCLDLRTAPEIACQGSAGRTCRAARFGALDLMFREGAAGAGFVAISDRRTVTALPGAGTVCFPDAATGAAGTLPEAFWIDTPEGCRAFELRRGFYRPAPAGPGGRCQ